MENAGRQNHSVKVIPNNCLPEIRTRGLGGRAGVRERRRVQPPPERPAGAGRRRPVGPGARSLGGTGGRAASAPSRRALLPSPRPHPAFLWSPGIRVSGDALARTFPRPTFTYQPLFTSSEEERPSSSLSDLRSFPGQHFCLWMLTFWILLSP